MDINHIFQNITAGINVSTKVHHPTQFLKLFIALLMMFSFLL